MFKKIHIKRKRPAPRNHVFHFDPKVSLRCETSDGPIKSYTWIGTLIHVSGNDNSAVINCAELFSKLRHQQAVYRRAYGDLYD